MAPTLRKHLLGLAVVDDVAGLFERSAAREGCRATAAARVRRCTPGLTRQAGTHAGREMTRREARSRPLFDVLASCRFGYQYQYPCIGYPHGAIYQRTTRRCHCSIHTAIVATTAAAHIHRYVICKLLAAFIPIKQQR